MTLNGHFVLKSVFNRHFMGWRVLAFGQNCSEICRTTHILPAAINVSQRL